MNETLARSGKPGPALAAWWANRFAPALRRAWARYGAAVQWLTIALMGGAASGRLAKGFWRLLFDHTLTGAVDLRKALRTTHEWFLGIPGKRTPYPSVYPPASNVLLWPLLGWLDFEPARWWWAATTVLALAWLAVIFVREAEARSLRERLFVVLMILAAAGTGISIGVGQLPLHILPAALAGVLLVVRRDDWRTDLAGAALVLFSLAKPHVAAPFVWVVVFVPGRLRPALLVGLGYVALTLLASPFQQGNSVVLLQGWATAAGRKLDAQGHANLSAWLADAGLLAWVVPAALAVLAALGAWVAANRKAGVWPLLGVAAVVARLWIYHAVYDDVLVIVPMVALYRLARAGPDTHGTDAAAGLALAVGLIMALAPARLINMGWPLANLYEAAQVASWLVIAAVLMVAARHQHRAALANPA